MDTRKYFPRRAVFQAVFFAVIFIGLGSRGWSQRADGGKRDVDVMSVNLYVGSEFSPVTSLNPGDPDFGTKLLAGVAKIYGNIVSSNFPVRAEGLAREIAARLPDLVALQEATLLRRQSPGDAIFQGTTPATQVEADYLAILLAALQRNGAHYAVAAMVEDTDVEVPMATSPTTFDDIRLTDRDVILMRTDLPPGFLRVSNSRHGNFAAFVPLPIGLIIQRGWCSVDVQIRGRNFRFINTHLEEQLPPGAPDIQAFQAAELLLDPANTAMPVVLAGDFNSDAGGQYGPTVYPLLLSSGKFTDAWSVARPGEAGLTWGHDELLSNLSVPFVYRLDYILYRGSVFQANDAEIVNPIIGTGPPFWFSDHAAIGAELAIH